MSSAPSNPFFLSARPGHIALGPLGQDLRQLHAILPRCFGASPRNICWPSDPHQKQINAPKRTTVTCQGGPLLVKLRLAHLGENLQVPPTNRASGSKPRPPWEQARHWGSRLRKLHQKSKDDETSKLQAARWISVTGSLHLTTTASPV